MSLRFSYVIALIGLFIPTTAPHANEGCTEIIASAHPEAPPAMWKLDTEIEGIGTDTLRLIGQTLGFTVQNPATGPWKRTLRALEIGEIDAITSLYHTSDRAKLYEYTVPYFDDPVSILVPKGQSFPFKLWSDLKNKRGAATLGDSYGNDFDNYIVMDLDVQRVSSYAQIFKLLKEKRIDYGIAPKLTAQAHAKKYGYTDYVEILPQLVATEQMYMAFAKTSACRHLIPQINQELARLRQNGTIDEIIAENIHKWSLQK